MAPPARIPSGIPKRIGIAAAMFAFLDGPVARAFALGVSESVKRWRNKKNNIYIQRPRLDSVSIGGQYSYAPNRPFILIGKAEFTPRGFYRITSPLKDVFAPLYRLGQGNIRK